MFETDSLLGILSHKTIQTSINLNKRNVLSCEERPKSVLISVMTKGPRRLWAGRGGWEME
jgi:hypothetical protein